MKKLLVSIGIAASVGLAAPVQACEKGWDDAGSIARDALVVAAFGVPAVQGDWDGVLQAGGSLRGTMLVTQGLKEVFPSRRPDGSDEIGRATCRERVCQSVSNSVVAGLLQKKTNNHERQSQL